MQAYWVELGRDLAFALCQTCRIAQDMPKTSNEAAARSIIRTRLACFGIPKVRLARRLVFFLVFPFISAVAR